MAHNVQAQRATGATTWQWLGDLRGALADRLSTYRLYRTTLSELDALSDRELSDLGLFRCDVRELARAAVYDER